MIRTPAPPTESLANAAEDAKLTKKLYYQSMYQGRRKKDLAVILSPPPLDFTNTQRREIRIKLNLIFSPRILHSLSQETLRELPPPLDQSGRIAAAIILIAGNNEVLETACITLMPGFGGPRQVEQRRFLHRG